MINCKHYSDFPVGTGFRLGFISHLQSLKERKSEEKRDLILLGFAFWLHSPLCYLGLLLVNLHTNTTAVTSEWHGFSKEQRQRLK